MDLISELKLFYLVSILPDHMDAFLTSSQLQLSMGGLLSYSFQPRRP